MEQKNTDAKQEALPVDCVEIKHVRAAFFILLIFQMLIGYAGYKEWRANKLATEALISSICDNREKRKTVDENYYDDLALAFSDNAKIHKIIQDRAKSVSLLIKQSTIDCSKS